jgi:hypothetical protein
MVVRWIIRDAGCRTGAVDVEDDVLMMGYRNLCSSAGSYQLEGI